MTLPVSASDGILAGGFFGEGCCRAVSGGVIGGVIGVPSIQHGQITRDPGAGQDADGVRVDLARGSGVVVDLCGPGAGITGQVREGGEARAGASLAPGSMGDVGRRALVADGPE